METEHEIQQTLNALRDTTKIIIAHRISAVRHADEIIYLADGKIAERGTHEELLAKKGLYYDTYMAQYGALAMSSASAGEPAPRSVLLRAGERQGCGECRTAREAKPPERAQRMRTSVSAPAGEPAPAACC